MRASASVGPEPVEERWRFCPPITEGWWTWEAKKRGVVVVWGRRRRVVVVVRRVAVDEVVARRKARWARARENIVVGLFCWRVLVYVMCLS